MALIGIDEILIVSCGEERAAEVHRKGTSLKLLIYLLTYINNQYYETLITYIPLALDRFFNISLNFLKVIHQFHVLSYCYSVENLCTHMQHALNLTALSEKKLLDTV